MRPLATITALLLSAAVSFAGPLNWSYTARFTGAGGAQNILLGKETRWDYDHSTGIETGTEYYVLLPVGTGLEHSGTVSSGQADVFGFDPSSWELSTTLPASVSDHQFEFTLTLTDEIGNVAHFSPRAGAISAMGVFTTGTGNFDVSFHGSQELQLTERRARVTYSTAGGESWGGIRYQVDDVTPVVTPEPGTLILGGIAIAGGLGAWARRRK